MPVSPCFINQATPRDIDKALTPERVSMFWRYAKANYIEKGLNYHDAIAQMAQKFNVPERLIAQAINKPKTVRALSDQVRARQRTTAQFLASNRRYLADMDKSGLQRAINFLSDGVRSTLLAFHGPVIPITHALDTAFRTPVTFLRTWVDAFRSLKPDHVDALYAKMQADPLYKTFKAAGAVIGRDDVAEGFAKTGWAARAMDAIKPLRFEWMKGEWEKLPNDLRTSEMAHELALQSAHATGAMLRNEPVMRGTGLVRKALLAPQLTFSKWMKTVVDPLKTINTFARAAEAKFNKSIPPPTPEERRIAWIRTRNAAIYMGSLYGALNLNKAFLQASGSKQKINMTNPLRGDFLALKMNGYYVRTRGTQEVLSFLAKLGALTKQAADGKKKPFQQSAEEAAMRYGEYKLTPLAAAVKEALTGNDIFGRPVPWSNQPGTKYAPRTEWPEFAAQHGPIFLGHAVSAFYDAMREQGVKVHDVNALMLAATRHPEAIERAAAEGGAEFFGVNLQKDHYIGR